MTDVPPGNDMEMELIENHDYSELPIVIARTINVVEVSDQEISRGARGIEFLMSGEPVPRRSKLSKKSLEIWAALDQLKLGLD